MFSSYNQQTDIFYSFKSVQVAKRCAGYMVTNLGDTVAFVNKMILNPDPRNVTTPTNTFRGDSVSIMLHENDVYSGRIEVNFQEPTTGVNPQVEVIQLFYTDEN